jgi:membrane-associated PAP2 superfamily phosphatase
MVMFFRGTNGSALRVPGLAARRSPACFPAAHAATGFMWLACELALHTSSPRLARRVILGALLLGAFMGLTRLRIPAQAGH